MIAFFTGTAIGRNLAALGAMLIALLAVAGALMSRGARNERDKAISRERKAHDRINDAPTLRDASDADRVDWLRAFARRHGN